MKDKEQEEAASSIFVDGALYEQVYNPETRKVAYAFLDKDGKTKTTDMVNDNGITYTPIYNNDVTEGAITLPEQPTKYESKTQLLKDITSHIHRYVDIDDIYEDICAWYIMMSWLYDQIPSVPYLRFLGDFQTGKSRASKVVTGLCYHPFQFITPSGPSLYRTLQRWDATLRIDEFDFRRSDAKADIGKILNAGYEQGNRVPRCSSDNYDDMRYFDVYGPKIIANKQQFDDPSLENRCITITMKQTLRDDIPRNLTDAFHQEQTALRDKLLMWRLKNYDKVDISKARELPLQDIDIRLQQITEGMISLFANTPAVIEKMKRVFRSHHRKMVQDRADTVESHIIQSLWALHEDGIEHISAGDIVTQMREKYEGYTDLHPASVGRKLSKLGIETTTPRKIDGTSKRCIKWDKELMGQLKRKFVVPIEDTTVTTGTTLKGDRGLLTLDDYHDEHECLP